MISECKNSLNWKKEDIVKEFFKLIPDFGYEDVGRYLDEKM